MGIYHDTYPTADLLRWPDAMDSQGVDWSERYMTAYRDRLDGDDTPVATFRAWEAETLEDVTWPDGSDVIVVVTDGHHGELHVPDDAPGADDHERWLDRYALEEWADDTEDEDGQDSARRWAIVNAFTDQDDLGWESSDGPMMNFLYPVAEEDESTARDWAYAIRDLPLCVVEVDGRHGLALTGGGMNLSWEIARAFVAIGYRPPVDVVSLPRMVDHTDERHRPALLATIDTAQALAANYARQAERWAEEYTVAIGPGFYDHDARPDGNPEEYARCTVCREDVAWMGEFRRPEWLHQNDHRRTRNA